MTALTDEGFSKVKKAKPRERPVSESRMIVQCVIGPNCSKYDLSESASGTSVVSDEGGASRRGGRRSGAPSVVSQFRPPMNILLQSWKRGANARRMDASHANGAGRGRGATRSEGKRTRLHQLTPFYERNVRYFG
jgi:hypothetical protein